MKANSVSTIQLRLATLTWNYAQRGGERLDRKDRAIATVMAGIRNSHAAPPPLVFEAISQSANAGRSSPAIRCELVWPLRPRSMNAMCRNSSATPVRK